MPGLRAGVIDVLHGEIPLVLLPFQRAPRLSPEVGQDPTERNTVFFEEREHPIIQQSGRRDRRLLVIHFREPHRAVGIDEGLLIDTPDARERAHLDGVMGAAVAGTLTVEFAMHFFVGLRLVQRHDLRLRQHQPLLGHLRLPRLEPVAQGLHIMPEPDTTHPRRRDGRGLFPELIGHTNLTPRRLDHRPSHRVL
jgi:hypothetical protein